MSARTLFFGTILVLALCAMALLNIATPAGAGLANDSAAYIAGARSILQGTGYSDIWLDSKLEAITHYPPLLSLSLAALGLLNIDPLRGARILNILLFGANTALMGWLGWRATRSRVAGIWLAAVFMLNASLLRVHVFALSEPLFLFLSLLGFPFIDLYMPVRFATPRFAKQIELGSMSKQIEPGLAHYKPQKMFLVALAGLSCGLAFLTRYSALALLPAFAIALLLLQKNSRPPISTSTLHRPWFVIKPIAIFFATAIPPMAGWFVRNKLSAGNITNRTFNFHPISNENIQPGFYNFAQFLMPVESWQNILIKSGWVQGLLAVVGLALLIWLVIHVWQLVTVYRLPNTVYFSPSTISFATVLYVFGYLGAVLFSMSFFDASTKFQPRILAPIYVSLMLLSAAFGVWLSRKNALALRGVALGLALVTLAFSAYGSLGQQGLATLSQAGQGYASWKWHDSVLMASLRDLPPGTTIYTNTPPAVYLVTGRASRTLPTVIDPVDNLPRGNYQADLAQMRADLLSGRAVLALFDTSTLEDALGIQNSADFFNGLVVLQKTQGDILYGRR